MPLSLFYSEENKYSVENMTRICFIKQQYLIDKFENIIKNLTK